VKACIGQVNHPFLSLSLPYPFALNPRTLPFSSSLLFLISVLLYLIDKGLAFSRDQVTQFNEVGDPFSLLTQFTSVKRYEQESILDFNIRFQKYWKRVPMSVRSQQSQALMYYLRAFPPYLSL